MAVIKKIELAPTVWHRQEGEQVEFKRQQQSVFPLEDTREELGG